VDTSLDVVLGDDHTVFLDALTTLLVHLGHRVPATAANEPHLLEAVGRYQPDVCVLESQMPDASGVEVVAALLAASPQTKVVLLTSDHDPETMHRAVQLGALGYVHKTRGVAVLLDVLARVMAGEIVIEGSFFRPETPIRSLPNDARRLAAYLTHRELETLGLLVAGAGTTTIARRFNVSTTTVRSHIQAVLTKLGVHSRLEAAALAVRFGLVDLEHGPEVSNIEDQLRARAHQS
jgi:two-component system nitrate/nitrite response regulator NarL